METNNKLREALSTALEHVNKLYDILSRPCVFIQEARQCCREARGVLIPALDEPAKNCEVGTADDWLARFNVVCERCSGSDCDHRLFKEEEVCDCFARFAQMPYKEGDEK